MISDCPRRRPPPGRARGAPGAAAGGGLLVTYGYNHGQPIRDVQADGYIDSLQQLIAAES